MSSPVAHKIEELEKELRELKKYHHQQLTVSMDNQQRLNRRRRNLPAELKVEIVDCFPVENAVHFLANVPNRLIIHHCAPRIRRMFEKRLDQIIAGYARTLPAPDCNGDIWLHYGHQYAPEMDIFLRYGAARCDRFFILRGDGDNGFVGYPNNFFDDLIKHYYETKVLAKAVHRVVIHLPQANPASWPTALVQPQSGEMNVEIEEWKFYDGDKFVHYTLRNKYSPGIPFMLGIYFEGNAKRYQQMTRFVMEMAVIW